VIVSLDDYESLKETAYLLRSPENARRLLTAIERLESGAGTARDLAAGWPAGPSRALEGGCD
jgi:antitoxin YefM